MAQSGEELMATELAKVSALGGMTGGIFAGGPLTGLTDAYSAGVGARFAAKFLPTETATENLVLKNSSAEALKFGYSVLTKLGKLQKPDVDAPYPLLIGVVGSGFLNMNPAVVYYEILKAGENECEVLITGAAKEGLLKQNTAAKAVQQVVAGVRAVGHPV